MLSGTFSCAALGPLVVVEQIMKALDYLNITADQLHPYMASSFRLEIESFSRITPYVTKQNSVGVIEGA